MVRPRSLLRPLAAVVLVGGLLTLPALATTPSSLAVPAAGGRATATFSGTIPAGTAPTSSCNKSVATSVNTVAITVPAGTYDKVKTVATFTITWTPVSAAQTSDEILTVTGPDGTVIGDSDGSTPVETVTTVDPAPGTYTITACGYVNAQAQPYDGTVALESTDRAAGPAVPTSSNVQNLTDGVPAFAPSTVVSAHLLGGEPQTTIARPVAGVAAGVVDPKAVFVDWPLSVAGPDRHPQPVAGRRRNLPADLRPAVPASQPSELQHRRRRRHGERGQPLHRPRALRRPGGAGPEALATSYDQGDTFPASAASAGTSPATGVDRQWLAAIDPHH